MKIVLHINYVVLHEANSALRKLILYHFLSITNILLNFFIIDLSIALANKLIKIFQYENQA